MFHSINHGIKDIVSNTSGMVPKRPYGNTGINLSVIGFGGIVVTDTMQAQANAIVANAVARGVNYFDVAPSYGNAQEILGPTLVPYRNDIFLACKTGERYRDGAEKEFTASLDILKTDYFDLYQLHAISSVTKDVDAAFSKAGVMPFLMEAKKQGQIRHLGFSAHSHEAALAAMDRYDFDSVLLPVNFASYTKNSFGAQVIETAKAKEMAVLALKSMARQVWSDGDPLKDRFAKCWYEPLALPNEIKLALAFTLSKQVTALLPPGEASLFQTALEIITKFKPVTAKEISYLDNMTTPLNPLFPIAT